MFQLSNEKKKKKKKKKTYVTGSFNILLLL